MFYILNIQICKCDNEECCQPKVVEQNLHWLPDPVLDDSGLHYRPFGEVFGKGPTTDDERPSNRPFEGKVTEEEQVSFI